MSLRELSAKKITSILSADAIDQLYGGIYVPYVENIPAIIRDLHNGDSIVETLSGFADEFPELLVVSNKPFEANWTFEWKENCGVHSCPISIHFLHHGRKVCIVSRIPFAFQRNNRLIEFFVSRNLAVFAGIKTLKRLRDEPEHLQFDPTQ